MLLVSGVGPAETLRKFDIPLQADVPGVGQGMWVRCWYRGLGGLE